ncbi:hypothetical protein CIB48_g4521 [Xylaria polymorpha]|nr:hypothetical protein CIB48_g4521 [Xylaria polymorpha]
MRAILPLLSLSTVAQALYFFIDGTQPKCFYEELPKDTLVVGHYTAEEYDDNARTWSKHEGLRSLRQRPPGGVATRVLGRAVHVHGARGRRPPAVLHAKQQQRAPGLAKRSHPNGGVRLTLDLAIGESSEIESTDKSKLQDISQRVKDLNSRLQDIRREQIFQREREAEFRDQSEQTNSRVIRWMAIQLVVLGVTCAWQLSHLRSFFIKQKLT